MRITKIIVATFVVAVFISSIQLPVNQEITQQTTLSLWQTATSVNKEFTTKTMLLAGNTACNPRAQVCED